jgi:hypothetical protein
VCWVGVCGSLWGRLGGEVGGEGEGESSVTVHVHGCISFANVCCVQSFIYNFMLQCCKCYSGVPYPGRRECTDPVSEDAILGKGGVTPRTESKGVS